MGEVLLEPTGDPREMAWKINILQRHIKALNGELALSEDLKHLLPAANCANQQRKHPERANLCSWGEEHNDTAAVAAGSPMPTRKQAPLAIGDHGEDSTITIRRGPSEFGADIFHTAAENEHGDDEDDESSDASSNFDDRSVFPEYYSGGSDREATAAAKSAAKKLSKGKPVSRKR